MNILLVTDSYPPEVRSASHLMQELAEGLKDRGHTVTVVTSYPQYNLTQESRGRSFNEFSIEDDINVIRVKTLPHHKVNFLIRGISQLSMPYIFLSRINRYVGKEIDIVIAYSPPLPLAKVGQALKQKRGTKFILNVQDIFPQNAIDLGAMKNRVLINFFERMEAKAYDSADYIAVHSEGNRRFLIQAKQAPAQKIQVLHNWIDLEPYIKVSRTNMFRERYGLDGKFVFLFAGVIGPSQGLDLIVDAAARVKDIKEICFLIVGDGMEKDRLIKMAEGYKLKNVIFKPFISREEYPALVKDVDAGLVCLTCKNKTPVVPGKILGYMAASIPVVAFLNRESDGHKMIRDARCGYSGISDDPDKTTDIILKIYNEQDKLRAYGKNGFNYVSNYFSKDVCMDRLEKLF